jgi:hypothetical protein
LFWLHCLFACSWASNELSMVGMIPLNFEKMLLLLQLSLEYVSV